MEVQLVAKKGKVIFPNQFPRSQIHCTSNFSSIFPFIIFRQKSVSVSQAGLNWVLGVNKGHFVKLKNQMILSQLNSRFDSWLNKLLSSDDILFSFSSAWETFSEMYLKIGKMIYCNPFIKLECWNVYKLLPCTNGTSNKKPVIWHGP